MLSDDNLYNISAQYNVLCVTIYKVLRKTCLRGTYSWCGHCRQRRTTHDWSVEL